MVTDVGALARGLNAGDVEGLERVMLESDFGLPATAELVDWIEGEIRKGKLKTDVDLRKAMGDRLTAMLTGPSDPGVLTRAEKPPSVVLVVGVNGVGKTTSIAKLAKRLLREKETVLLAAGDTYRAGAIQQLNVWADRLGIQCVSGAPGGDPAAVAFDAIEAAEKRGISRVIVDTAGRLHTQEGLMEELRKVARVIGRRAPGGPHETLLVLDGTVGQNAVQQGKLFTQAVPVSGLVVTKLDGTARGGAVLAIADQLGLPISVVGLGEGLEDWEPFEPEAFARGLFS
jgi:fused signal recognition particle receptor